MGRKHLFSLLDVPEDRIGACLFLANSKGYGSLSDSYIYEVIFQSGPMRSTDPQTDSPRALPYIEPHCKPIKVQFAIGQWSIFPLCSKNDHYYHLKKTLPTKCN